MKNLSIYQETSETARRDSNAFAPRPGYIDPDPVTAEIERVQGVMHVDDMQDVDRTLMLVTVLYKLMQFFRRVVTYNDTVKTKWDMLTTPSWRRRVWHDLGGEPALRRWEARQARALEPALDKPDTARGIRAETGERETPRYLTDRDGLFRLAPITRARETKTTVPLGLNLGLGLPKDESNTNKPIPLTAGELRGDCIHTLDIETPDWDAARLKSISIKPQITKLDAPPKPKLIEGREPHLRLTMDSDHVEGVP